MLTGPITDLYGQVGIGNLINSDRFLELSRTLDIPYVKRDFLFRSGVWRNEKQLPIYRHSENSGLLIVGHGDKSTSALDQRIARIFGVQYIFGANLLPVKGFSTAIPLGLTNFTNESDIHPVLGDVKHLERAWNSHFLSHDFQGTVLVGFSQQTNPIRKKLLQILRDEKNTLSVTYHTVAYTEDSRTQFLSKTREHDMVLCPEGNGFDTHRFWETLYMGGIPVVVKNQYLDSLFDNFPCIALESWMDLFDAEYIYREWLRAKNHTWDVSLLTFDYWKTEIEKKSISLQT